MQGPCGREFTRAHNAGIWIGLSVDRGGVLRSGQVETPDMMMAELRRAFDSARALWQGARRDGVSVPGKGAAATN